MKKNIILSFVLVFFCSLSFANPPEKLTHSPALDSGYVPVSKTKLYYQIVGKGKAKLSLRATL